MTPDVDLVEQPRPSAPPADPVRALENTRRTLLKLVENIDAAIRVARETAGASR